MPTAHRSILPRKPWRLPWPRRTRLRKRAGHSKVGTKWDLFARKLSLRAAGFRTDKTNARETVNATTVVLSGSQRVNGFQVQANGYITSRWEILASYAYLDGKVTGSAVFPLSVGAQLANVPRNTFSTWSTFDLPWHLSIGGGADFVDSRTASSTTPLDPVTGLVKQVPGYWVFNAMAKYPLSEHFDFGPTCTTWPTSTTTTRFIPHTSCLGRRVPRYWESLSNSEREGNLTHCYCQSLKY